MGSVAVKILFVLLLIEGCSSSSSDKKFPVEISYNKGSMVWDVKLHGQSVMKCPDCGYHIVGSCGGPDDVNQNVTSVGADGKRLFAPDPVHCPPSPYSMVIRRIDGNTFESSIVVGPMAADHISLSIPFTVPKSLYHSYALENQTYKVGACGIWFKREGDRGLFKDIPTPCNQPGIGKVGLAEANNKIVYAEIYGDTVKVSRIVLSNSGLKYLQFFNSPLGVYNSEYSFGQVKKNQTVHLVERIHISHP